MPNTADSSKYRSECMQTHQDLIVPATFGQGYIFLYMQCSVKTKASLTSQKDHLVKFVVNIYSSTKYQTQTTEVLSLCSSAFEWLFGIQLFLSHFSVQYYPLCKQPQQSSWVAAWLSPNVCDECFFFFFSVFRNICSFLHRYSQILSMEAKSHHKQPLELHLKRILKPSVKCNQPQLDVDTICKRGVQVMFVFHFKIASNPQMRSRQS